jgi:hypothetical protein
VDLKTLPDRAFTLYKGDKGEFYQATFDLALVFRGVLVLQFMYGDAVIKEESCKYSQNSLIRSVSTGPLPGNAYRPHRDGVLVGGWNE